MFAFCLTAGLGLLINSVTAHPQPGVRLLAEDECTTSIPAFQSYHIHTLFWQNNGNSTKAAEKLEAAFMEEFNLTREANSCLYNPGDLRETELCVFETDYVPAGPFVTAQTALFVPVSMLESALSWMVQHRGKLDVFIHPNSGCMIQDHIVHGIWAGNKWEVDPSIFLD